MAVVNFTSWLSDEGRRQFVKWAWLIDAIDTAKIEIALAAGASIPGSWVQISTLSGHDLTVNTTDAQFDERLYGINQKVVSKVLSRSPAESVSFNVDDLSILALEALLSLSGFTPAAANVGSPVVGTRMPRYVAEGVRFAHTFVGSTAHTDHEVQWYVANGLTSWRDVKDGTAFVHQVSIEPDLETANNLNFYRFETVYPELTA